MPPLTDPDRLAAFTDALGNWSVTDYIQFRLEEEAYRFIKRELGGIKLRDIGRLMYEFVDGGGEIDEQLETRERWRTEHEFHHDLRFTINDTAVYIETRLHYRLPVKPDDSWIEVVNIHAPK